MKKILIGDHNEMFSTAVAAALGDHYEVHICHDGIETLAQINALHPDVLIINLCLNRIAGLTVLERADYKPPVILATTTLYNDDVLKAARAVGVQDVILIPCTLDYVLKHLDALLQQKAPSSGI